ncbi:MAG: HypC/HybG/HupF family hydrogenase formation chaperone [Hyphomicrobiales bacterium]|nr:MAG: HypC/HybG/HupF family hydrogenase formation chaperone [Hyphomicrobiales bacterium]
MCLTIPMRVTEIDGFNARCEAKGSERTASLFMLQDEPVVVGDYVIIEGGYIVRTMSESDAHAAWALFDEILATPGT